MSVRVKGILGIAIVTAMTLCASSGLAQNNPVERRVKVLAGGEVRLGVYTNIRPDCTSGPMPTLRIVAAPEHGQVSIKQGSLSVTNFKNCNSTTVPVLVAFYKATVDFVGMDAVTLQVSMAGGGTKVEQITVSVRTDAGAPATKNSAYHIERKSPVARPSSALDFNRTTTVVASPVPVNERRIALVIGNNDYLSKNVEKLKLAVADAKAMTTALKERGFDVISGYDLRRREMNCLISDFLNRLSARLRRSDLLLGTRCSGARS